VIGAEWSEIDLEAKLWTIPADRMKGRRQHRVPLSDRALEILAELPRDPETPTCSPAPARASRSATWRCS
jgi:integrase